MSKLPPYGTKVDTYPEKNQIIICTGSEAWQRAKSKSWMRSTPKLVLPLTEPPDAYKWPVANRHVMVFSYGVPEAHQRLIDLSRCLLEHGAIWVLWVMRPMTKIERPNREGAQYEQ